MSTNGNGSSGSASVPDDAMPGANAVPGLRDPDAVPGLRGPDAVPGLRDPNAVDAATEFIEAVVWGEHHKVWALLGEAGKSEVLEVATKRGMDENQAARLKSGTGSEGETNEFLADLVNGLRSELAGNDLDHITYQMDANQSDAGKAVVVMHVPLHPNLGGTLPIGTLEMSNEESSWKIERLIPLTSK